MINYRYTETPKIKELLIELEALRILFDHAKTRPTVEDNLRRASLLKSALFSAKIEGNPLSIEKMELAVETKGNGDLKKLEVFNLLRAYRYVYSSEAPQKISINLIKKIHKITMNSLSASSGSFRDQPWAVFNQAGVAVYLAPAAFKLPGLMEEFIKICQTLNNEVPVKAAIIQFLFEKIHPFADGNGRVGRLISALVMKSNGYNFRGVVSIEEMIDKNRESYYEALEPLQNTNAFVEFFLQSFVEQAKSVFDKLNQKEEEQPEDFLLPRRREILETIKDHPYCSFDFISRRFSQVNPKTIHYDLGKLQEKGFIIKAGKTRGVSYRLKTIAVDQE